MRSRIMLGLTLWVLVIATAPSHGATLLSTHFRISYPSQRVTETEAEEVRTDAEAAWIRCSGLFQNTPAYPIPLAIDPDLRGASGVTMFPGHGGQPSIRVRLGTLDYPGLPMAYVVTHEIGHVFSGPLAQGPLGEGIADWAAGAVLSFPLRPWCGRALQQGSLWVDPDALFITGDFVGAGHLNPLIRSADYTESALLVQFLVGRFGWLRFRSFASEYGRARGSLTSSRRHPNPSAVRAAFQNRLGESWETLRQAWETAIDQDPTPPGAPARLVQAQTIYGRILEYERWLIAASTPVSVDKRQDVEDAFSLANRTLREGDLEASRQALATAMRLVDDLRHPVPGTIEARSQSTPPTMTLNPAAGLYYNVRSDPLLIN